MSRLYVSTVQGDDITVWVLYGGHAYPFVTAERASYHLLSALLGDLRWSELVEDDAGFEALRADPDVWWDQRPGPLDGGDER